MHWGDGTSNSTSTPGDLNHTYADGLLTPTITLTIDDEDGRHNNVSSKAITVNNVAPTIDLVGADSVDEGSIYTLTLAGITDPGVDTVSVYTIDWGDGNTDVIPAAALPANGEVEHTYIDGLSTPTITVDLDDEDGTHLAAGTKNITVNDVEPTVVVSGADSLNEGELYTLTVGAITDPGDDTVENLTINWGDGSSENIAIADLPPGGEFTHVYADGDATPTITVDLEDEEGNHLAAGSKSITVNNVAPTVELSGDDDVDEGATYSLTIGAITDPGTDTVEDYIIDWGDGSSDTVSAADLANDSGVVDHVYADGDSSPTITVDLVDEDGTHTDAGSKSITVNNVAPTVDLSGDNDVDEGSTYSLTIGAITDPGTDTVEDYIIDWGDGSSDTVSAADLANDSGVVDHVYADGDSSPTITVDLVDEDGTHTDAGSKSITVNNVAPTV